jgi:hypothetical protein
MDNWIKIASAIYYTGVGAVLLGTSVRFLYRLVKGYDRDQEFLDELREIHLTNIYTALQKIAEKLNISLDIKAPGL